MKIEALPMENVYDYAQRLEKAAESGPVEGEFNGMNLRIFGGASKDQIILEWEKKKAVDARDVFMRTSHRLHTLEGRRVIHVSSDVDKDEHVLEFDDGTAVVVQKIAR
jgi:hypothetical protein